MGLAKRITRKLTDAEGERIRQVRALVEAEREQIIAKGRRIKAAHEAAQTRLQEAFDLLKAERLRQGLSLSDIQARTGMPRSMLSRLENDPRPNPTLTTLERYAGALGKDLRILLADKA
ncbi:MAG: helix-turn-helix transcriptional regulator [Planctomycetes bacterium]|nr:helix-turn-helix transcriptional regulator [Planctomycetota bacterium]